MKQRPLRYEIGQETAIPRRPHHVSPSLASVRLIIVDFRDKGGILGSIAAGSIARTTNSTARVLRRAGVNAEVWLIQNANELLNRLEQEEYRSPWAVTHVVLHTPGWNPNLIRTMADRWPNTEFVELGHSGLAYLSLDSDGAGITGLRKVLNLQTELHNVRVAAVNRRVIKMFNDCYRQAALYLPNLYYWEDLPHARARANFDPLRVGSFGVGRDWKNQEVACQAAMAMANHMDVSLELHSNIDPHDTYKRMRNGRKNYISGQHKARLIEHPWSDWTEFRQLVRSMDILLSPSFDETFCLCCADGIVEGVPTVGSDAMEWLPGSWRCREPFDQASVAATGMSLLHNRIAAVHDGREALAEYVERGTQIWISYLVQ